MLQDALLVSMIGIIPQGNRWPRWHAPLSDFTDAVCRNHYPGLNICYGHISVGPTICESRLPLDHCKAASFCFTDGVGFSRRSPEFNPRRFSFRQYAVILYAQAKIFTTCWTFSTPGACIFFSSHTTAAPSFRNFRVLQFA